MASWNYSNVGLFFDTEANNEELIKQVMSSLDFEIIDKWELYCEEDGVNGPMFKSPYLYGPTLCYKSNNTAKIEELFCSLNAMFSNIDVYTVSAKGNSVSDYYSGVDDSFDMVSRQHIRREFDYCYGNSTAFGRSVRSNVSEKGSRTKKETIDQEYLQNYSASLLKKLIAAAKKLKFTELLEIAQKVPAPAVKKKEKAAKPPLPESISGLKFVVTGDLKKFTSRSELEAFIESRGGKLVGSVSSKTNYLITNFPNSGTTKVQKAQELGVQIISEAQFLKMAK